MLEDAIAVLVGTNEWVAFKDLASFWLRYEVLQPCAFAQTSPKPKRPHSEWIKHFLNAPNLASSPNLHWATGETCRPAAPISSLPGQLARLLDLPLQNAAGESVLEEGFDTESLSFQGRKG